MQQSRRVRGQKPYACYHTTAQNPVCAWNSTSAPKARLLNKNTKLPVQKAEGGWIIVSLHGRAETRVKDFPLKQRKTD